MQRPQPEALTRKEMDVLNCEDLLHLPAFPAEGINTWLDQTS